jgi:hypothetical protein
MIHDQFHGLLKACLKKLTHVHLAQGIEMIAKRVFSWTRSTSITPRHNHASVIMLSITILLSKL